MKVPIVSERRGMAAPVHDKRTRLGYLRVAGAATCWGLWSIVLRPVERLQTIAPSTECFVLFLVMFVSLAPFARTARAVSAERPPAWVSIALFTVLGVCDALNVLFFFWAMQRTSLAIAVLTHYLAPILVALGAPLLLHERMGARTWAALSIALIGLTLMLEPWQGGGHAPLIGALLGSASAIFYAANTLLCKTLQRWFASSQILAWHLPVSLLVLWACVPRGGLELELLPLAILAFGSLVLGAMAGLLYLRGLELVPASHAAVLTLIEPAVAVLVGIVVWRETPSVFGAIGAALIGFAAARVLADTPPAVVDIK